LPLLVAASRCRFSLPFGNVKTTHATISPDQNISRYLTNQGVEELRNRGTAFHCSTEGKAGRAEFRPVSARLSPASAENEIKSISNISWLLDHHLHLPCICREKLYLAVKSMGCAKPSRLFEN
jgi:hypothetical protein